MADSLLFKIVYNHFGQIARELGPKVDACIAKAAMDIEGHAKSIVPVRTGFLKNSITSYRVGQCHWRVIAGADYAIYVEMGTRHMAAQPYMGPSVNKVVPELTKAIKAVAGTL